MGEEALLDRFDRAILEQVAAEGRITIRQLADRIGLSATPCQARLRRLEREGYILGYHARIDPIKMGQNHVAFVQIKLSDTRDQALNQFNAAVAKIPQIEQCHMIAGSFDYLLKVRTSDIAAYRAVLGEKISGLPHVANSSTFFAMEAVVE